MTSRQRSELRLWERMLLVLFGLTLAGIDADPDWIRITFILVGWSIVVSAIGLAELAMALYYRTRRSVRSGPLAGGRRRP